MDNIDLSKAHSFAQKRFPGIWPSLGWVILFFILQFIISIVAVLAVIDFSTGVEAALQEVSDYKIIALPTILALAISNGITLCLLLFYLRQPERRAAIGLDRWSNLGWTKTLALVFLLIGCGLALNYGYEALLSQIAPDVKLQEELRKLFAALPDTALNSALLFFTAAILAPVVEELLFRGLLQKSLSLEMPIWLAIAISATLFGVMHMDLTAMPVLIGMGVVFGMLYHLTGSLRLTIAAHLLNNSAALALS
jgi:membrane protease YdiL (CAAX protease family)